MLCYHKTLGQNVTILIFLPGHLNILYHLGHYIRLRDDFKLPTVRRLSTLTSKVSKFDGFNFLGDIFCKISENQKKCILLVYHVYVKLLYNITKEIYLFFFPEKSEQKQYWAS